MTARKYEERPAAHLSKADSDVLVLGTTALGGSKAPNRDYPQEEWDQLLEAGRIIINTADFIKHFGLKEGPAVKPWPWSTKTASNPPKITPTVYYDDEGEVTKMPKWLTEQGIKVKIVHKA